MKYLRIFLSRSARARISHTRRCLFDAATATLFYEMEEYQLAAIWGHDVPPSKMHGIAIVPNPK
jgi:hypothetical protein